MAKKDSFNAASKYVITYGDVMRDLNYISQTSGDDAAHFATDLTNIYGKRTSGFVFNGIATRLKLSQLLDKLGILYVSHFPTPDPTRGEIHIDIEFAQMASNLFANWQSCVIIEQHITGNKKTDDKWHQIVAHIR